MISDHMHARVAQDRVKSHCACEHGQTSKATVDVAKADVKKQRGERDDKKDDVTHNLSLYLPSCLVFFFFTLVKLNIIIHACYTLCYVSWVVHELHYHMRDI